MGFDKWKKTGFTLAEVLITLAIIGIVASLTIPSVIWNYQETQTVSALKKFYTEISQAYTRAQIDNGTPETWDWGTSSSGVSADKIIDYLAPYLKITKRCGNKGGCLASDTYTTLNKANDTWTGPNSTTYASAQLANGVGFWVYTYGSDYPCAKNWGTSKAIASCCGSIGVDVNGNKKPNQLGRDAFWFYFTKYGVIPIGTKDSNNHTLSAACNMSSEDAQNGIACTAWIIGKGNMDYLKHSVSW